MSYASTILGDGAIAYWRLGETSGTAAADSAGAHPGVYAGTFTLNQTGALPPTDGNPAVLLDGISGVMKIAGYNALSGLTAVTLEAWVNHNGIAWNASHEMVICHGQVGSYLSVQNGKLFGSLKIAGAQQTAPANGAVLTTGWHHIVMTFATGDNIRLYLDGAATDTAGPFSGSLTSDAAGMAVGVFGAFSAPVNFYKGLVDEAAIYQVALTPAQILAHYQLGAQRTYADRVRTGGAIAYWRLNEPSGTNAADLIGGNNGVISGGVTLGASGATADGDAAMKFDGASGKIQTASPYAALTVGGTYSIEAWVNGFSNPVDNNVFAHARSANDRVGLVIDPTGRARYGVWNSATWLSKSGQIQGAGWHHLVATCNAGTQTLYIDGVVPTELFLQGYSGSLTAAQIGWSGTGAGQENWFGGAIDEVAVYPTALSAATVNAHYASGRSLYADRVIGDGAIAYWPLNERTGTSAVDVAGGNTGTIVGGVTLGQAGATTDGGTAMTFNGTTGVITTTYVPTLGAGSASVEGWFRASAIPGVRQWLIDFKGGNTANTGMSLALNTTGGVIGKANTTTLGSPVVGKADGAWHHVVLTLTRLYNGTQDLGRVYVDGVLEVEGAVAPLGTLTGTDVVLIGRDNPALGFWVGSLDDIAIYNVALTPGQVAAHVSAAFAGGATGGIPGWLALGDDYMAYQYNLWTPITPSDSVDLSRLTNGILVGGGGDVAAVMQNNQAVTLRGLPAGAWVPIACRRVNATGTTATNLVALYQA